jgi:PhnB protein
MQMVSAYLAVANVGATIEFLQRAFGFAPGVTLADPDGQLRYAEMRHGDSVIILVRQGDATSPTSGAAALYAYVPNVDEALMRAREAGAGVADAEDRAWGDRTAEVVDPDGYRWVLATFKKLAPFT